MLGSSQLFPKNRVFNVVSVAHNALLRRQPRERLGECQLSGLRSPSGCAQDMCMSLLDHQVGACLWMTAATAPRSPQGSQAGKHGMCRGGRNGKGCRQATPAVNATAMTRSLNRRMCQWKRTCSTITMRTVTALGHQGTSALSQQEWPSALGSYLCSEEVLDC